MSSFGGSQKRASRRGSAASGGLSSTQKLGGRMSAATEQAFSQIHVQHVTQAKEFQDYKRLPKFSHVPMAVIHPSPKKKRPVHRRTSIDLELVADAARQHAREDQRREIPESLTRPPAELNRKRTKSA